MTRGCWCGLGFSVLGFWFRVGVGGGVVWAGGLCGGWVNVVLVDGVFDHRYM